MGSRVAVFPPGRQELYTANKYSAAVKAGSRVGGSPEPDPEAQLRLAFRNLNAVLDAGGCTFDDVVDFTFCHVDENDSQLWRKVSPEFWGEPPYPPLTGIGVTRLSGFRFELKVTAKLPEDVARG